MGSPGETPNLGEGLASPEGGKKKIKKNKFEAILGKIQEDFEVKI